MTLPKDPVILLSYVNTQLRDHYNSLSELAKACGVPESDITDRLAQINYRYDASTNKFI